MIRRVEPARLCERRPTILRHVCKHVLNSGPDFGELSRVAAEATLAPDKCTAHNAARDNLDPHMQDNQGQDGQKH